MQASLLDCSLLTLNMPIPLDGGLINDIKHKVVAQNATLNIVLLNYVL